MKRPLENNDEHEIIKKMKNMTIYDEINNLNKELKNTKQELYSNKQKLTKVKQELDEAKQQINILLHFISLQNNKNYNNKNSNSKNNNIENIINETTTIKNETNNFSID